MTRINVVPPAELHSKHLVAEYRELPRVFALVVAAAKRGESPTDKRNPTEYTLGTGHVRFFYSRLFYLTARHEQLVAEMVARGFKPKYLHVPVTPLGSNWYNNYIPTPEALAINRQRLIDRKPK